MKSIYAIISFILVSVCFITCSKNKHDMEEQSMTTRDFPKIVFGTKSHPCSANDSCYCTGDRGICLIIDWKIANTSDFNSQIENEGIAEVVNLPNNKIKFKMLKDNSVISQNSDTLFYVSEDYLLNGLFIQNLTIKEGVYSIDYSTNTLGDIIMDTY